MDRNNKENQKIDVETAKKLLHERMKRIRWGLKEPFNVWISDPIPIEPWGYYFLTEAYSEGEEPGHNALKVFVDKRTGEVAMAACVMG